MRSDELDFNLPPGLVAQVPAARRAESRLLTYRRSDGELRHRSFSDLPSLLRPGDLLVFNDVRVLPARFMLRKSTGGRVEGLFLEELRPGVWSVLLRDVGKVSGPLVFVGREDLTATITHTGLEGEREITLSSEEPAADILDHIGRMPLPPYIKRAREEDERDDLDRQRYQTVFARHPGAVAAPTAALHFGEELFAQLEARGVERCFVTLHVGRGTFKPVTAEQLEQHAMHSEDYSIEAPAAEALNRAKEEKRRIIAVGTTSARVLESQEAGQAFAAKKGQTRIFIYPPYSWRHVDALITNFHLPRSTLIALVAAMVGLERQREIYRIAVEQGYRFFSYGDAMFLE